MSRVVGEVLGTFAAELSWRAVPPQVADRTRDRVLDALSTAAVARAADTYGPVDRLLAGEAAGIGTVLASGGTADAGMAAFANGVAVHALLYEDLDLHCAAHPGAAIVPAALAIAEACDATIADFLAGVLAGYETQLLLGTIAGAGVIARGFRTTSVFGTVAAAVACAKVMRLDAERIAAAAGVGVNFAGGLTEGLSHGADEPYFEPGAAAQQGLMAARLAAAGSVRGAPMFEGRNGFFRAFADAMDDESVVPGAPWRIMDMICKPYPCSGGKIGAIDSARALLEEGLDASQIARVTVWLPALYYGYPGANRPPPFASMAQAQASGQFCVAAALLGYDMTAIETFTRDFANADIAALGQRVELQPQPGTQLAKVAVMLTSGEVRTTEADWRDRQVPSLDKMAAKLKMLTAARWRAGSADQAIALLRGDGSRRVRELCALMRS